MKNSPALKSIPFIALIGAFIGFLGPFGMDTLPVYVSMSYWIFVCLMGYGIYSPMIHLTNAHLVNSHLSNEVKVSLAVFPAGLILSLLLPLLNMVFFNHELVYWQTFKQTLIPTLVIGAAITFISYLKTKSGEQAQTLSEATEEIVQQKQQKIDSLINQLPLEKRGELVCLEMDDHYLKVHTDKGHHLVLMRFKDALELLDDYPGIQTHRSWWVADTAVRTSTKENRKTLLVLNNDVQVPVSKTYLDGVKARYAI